MSKTPNADQATLIGDGDALITAMVNIVFDFQDGLVYKDELFGVMSKAIAELPPIEFTAARAIVVAASAIEGASIKFSVSRDGRRIVVQTENVGIPTI